MTTLDRSIAPPALARRPVLAVAAAVAVVLAAASARGWYFFDELYFLMAGREHLAWGYFDQPPLIPALAATLDSLAPGSLLVFRLPVTLGGAAMVVLAAALARELGGRRGPQVLAAVAVAVSAVPISSHWLATYTLDPLWWTLIIWLVARWVRVRDDRLLLLAGRGPCAHRRRGADLPARRRRREPGRADVEPAPRLRLLRTPARHRDGHAVARASTHPRTRCAGTSRPAHSNSATACRCGAARAGSVSGRSGGPPSVPGEDRCAYACSAAYPGLITSLMSASRSSKRRNADFIALTVNHCRSAQS